MSLLRLTQQEIEGYREFLLGFLKQGSCTGSDLAYLDEGTFKTVFMDPSKRLAYCISKSSGDEFPAEFGLMKKLHESCPAFFPEPAALDIFEGRHVMTLELLDHRRVNWFKRDNKVSDKRIAYAIGYAAGYVFSSTGMFTSEPHDGNVLLRQGVEANFVDADHFVEGTESALFGEYFQPMWGRIECIVNRREFEKAFWNGMNEKKI